MGNKDSILENFSKDEYITLIAKLKYNLEAKLNGLYLPLQKQMINAENTKDVKKYYELESQIAPLRKEVAEEYDQLLKVRNRFYELYGS